MPTAELDADTIWEIVCGTGHRSLSDQADEPWTRQKMVRCAQWLRDERGTRGDGCQTCRPATPTQSGVAA